MCSDVENWGWQPGRLNTRMVRTTYGGGMVCTFSVTGSSIFCWLRHEDGGGSGTGIVTVPASLKLTALGWDWESSTHPRSCSV